MDSNNLLQQLKDIHNPAPVSWWPLAPGWYIVAFIIIVILLLFIFWWRKRQRHQGKYLYIKQQLEQVKAQAEQQDPMTASHVSTLLRRMVLLNYPRDEVAGLSGEAWLVFLDNTMNSDQFSQGPGRLLVTAAYQQQWDQQTHELINLVEQWMKQCLK